MVVLLALLKVMFSGVLSLFHNGVLGQVWYLIVSIPDLCLLPYFNSVSLNGTCWVLLALFATFLTLKYQRRIFLGKHPFYVFLPASVPCLFPTTPFCLSVHLSLCLSVQLSVFCRFFSSQHTLSVPTPPFCSPVCLTVCPFSVFLPVCLP